MLIRGLTFVRTELQWTRQLSPADGYRGLNFNDISPELMAGVDVYKNQTAEMIEGGIAGTVNLRTRLPSRSLRIACSRSRRLSQLWRSQRGHNVRGLGHLLRFVADRTSGASVCMANYAYSHVKTQTEGVIMQRIGAFCDSGNAAERQCHRRRGRLQFRAHRSPYGGSGWRYLPSQVNFSQVLYDRVRYGSSAALQFESSDKRVAGESPVHGLAVRQRVARAQLECFFARIVGERRRTRRSSQRLHRSSGRHACVHVRPPMACWNRAC